MSTPDEVFVVFCRDEIYGCHDSEWRARNQVDGALPYDATDEQREAFKIRRYVATEETE